MSTDLVPTNGTTEMARTDDFAQQIEFARMVAGSSLVPKAYRDDPGAVLIAVGLGAAMGLSKSESLYRIHVIEGKPSASGELIAANVRRAGHRLRILHSDTERCTVEITRADDPEPHAETWTIAEAQAAGLTRKDNWKNYPSDMLFNRAVSRCARRVCSEALYGVIYTEEEAREVTVTQDGPGVRESAADALAPQQQQTQAEPQHPDGVTSGQLKKLGALMREADITERDQALRYVADIIGREIGSRNELTKAEASQVIDVLEAEARADPATGEIPDGENPGFSGDTP
jgi:hypothetical protein